MCTFFIASIFLCSVVFTKVVIHFHPSIFYCQALSPKYCRFIYNADYKIKLHYTETTQKIHLVINIPKGIDLAEITRYIGDVKF